MNDIEPEDLKRIDDFAQEFATYADQQNGDHSYNESAYTDFKLGAEYEHRYMAAKQAELVEEHKNFKAAIADTILEIENKFHAEQAENERLKNENNRLMYSPDTIYGAKINEQATEIERLKSQLKDYCNDCQHPTVNERQAAELSKLRQENEAKRSDLTDKLEEAVHHMDNGHTAQATTLIYEVIGELEPKGE